MTTITISRQMGSQGRDVAHAVANYLGYKLYWRELINQAALRSGSPEMALHMIDDLGLLDTRPSLQVRRAYRNALEQVMQELAQTGDVVIVGRAGQLILKDQPDVFHVRVIAPLEVRIRRVAESEGITPEAARARIEASDRSRATFLRRNYQADIRNPELYDLVINTEYISPETAAQLVCKALETSMNTAPSSRETRG